MNSQVAGAGGLKLNSFVLLNESARICVFSMWAAGKEGLLVRKKNYKPSFFVCFRKVFIIFPFGSFYFLLIRQNLISLYVRVLGEMKNRNREQEEEKE